MNAVFPSVIYLLCFAASGSCAWLLGRNYVRTGARLLLWSAICFSLLALNNLFVIIDLVYIQTVDLASLRLLLSLGAISVILFGFIWDLEEDI